jgi:hypothetical protein
LECTNFNLPVPKAGAGTNITVKVVDDGNGLEGPEYGEGDLDIQSTIAMAPLCNLIVYDNDEPSGDADYIGVLSQEADDNSADVITESYGWFLDIPTALAAHNLHVSMSAQGITYLAASGDSGTTLDYAYPDIDPEILSVGGTSATVNSENLRLTEVGWNSDGGAGGGGWVDSLDTFNIRPAYQSTPAFLAWSGVPSIKSVPYRLIPDIALNADPNTGFYVWFPGGYQVFGGTSGASPTCAGSLGITEQQLISDGFLHADSSGHSRFGRIQDLLYSYNGDPSVFFDVVSGTNGALPNGAVSVAVPGWDTDSGWGPIIFAGLVAKIEGIPEVSTLKLSNSAISGGVSVTGTLTLSFPASKGGTAVELLSSGPDVQVPSSVTVPAGATTISFPVTSNGVAHGETLTISASNAYGLESANLSIFPATYTGLSLSAAAVAGGNTVTGTISLSGAAPPGGFVIDLTSSSSAAKVPSTVTVPANSSSVNFSIATSPIMSNTSATISGESSNTATFSQTLGIQTATVQSVTLSSASVVGGSTSVLTGTIVLDGPALPSGDEVSLLSSNSKLATVNKTVKVMAGATTVSFTVDHFVTATSGETSITARFNGVSQTATVSVVPFQLSSLTVTPTAVNGGVSSTGSVTLNAAPGPHSGVVSVKLQSSSKSVTVPTSITVPTGSATGSFTVKTAGVGSTTSATITASYKSSTESVSISVNPTVLASILATPGVVKGSSTTKVVGTVSLNGVAPSGGFVIHLSSSDPSAAGVASIVTVPAGKTSVTFAISHKKIASQEVVSLTATANGMTEATTLTITP